MTTYTPKTSTVRAQLSGNLFVLRISELDENGEPTGGITTRQIDVQAIDGSPEGRSVGSPGDLRIQRDVPQLWQKAEGVRTKTGWVPIAGTIIGDTCPTNVVTVGPGCEFTTIQPAIDFAASLAGTSLVQVAPGTYAEDLTLIPGVALAGIENASVIVAGTATVPGTAAGSIRLQDLTLTPPAGDALVISGASTVVIEGERLRVNGNITATNSAASTTLILRASIVSAPGPTAIAWSGAASSVLELDDTNVSVNDAANNVAIDFNAGTLIAQYALIVGLVDLGPGTNTGLLFSRIAAVTQECLIIGAGATVEAIVVDLQSNNPSGSVIAGGGGSIVFSNLSLSGSAKDYTGAASTDQSEAYDAANAADWAVASPLTVKEALDRLAAAVAGLLGAPIP